MVPKSFSSTMSTEVPVMATKPDFFVSVGSELPGEGWHVFLSGSAVETVCIGPFENQAVAQEMANKIEKYVTMLVESVQAAS